MASRPKHASEHMFSIQLNSKNCVKCLAFPNGDGKILIEGFLGKLENLVVTEGILLEINGCDGSLKMDLTALELQELLEKNSKKPKKSSKHGV